MVSFLFTSPSGLATCHAEDLWKMEEVRNKVEWGMGSNGKLRHSQWKASNMHISIRRCTTLLGKKQNKRAIWHNSSKHIALVKMSVVFYRNVPSQGGGGKGNSVKVTRKQQLTLSPSSRQLCHLKAIWLNAKACREGADNRKVSFIVKDSYTLKMTLKRG